ncbi:DUF2007 domain-containing protein [Dongia soli]|uniref:DUF2007 domain-containing protein n=1 Tax=Dongia soli TaxID=600628 RepID=A0ABU5EBI0_9PROT|nr:DUF2007 domain-containing protein [Dongia soli]MDY0883511.1 DUF2007 domain-containing protein [Dongia soli]
MRELTRSNDPIRLSFLTSLLSEAGIESVILDSHTSIVQGSLNMLEQRLMVAEQDLSRATRLMRDAEAAILQPVSAAEDAGDED